MNRLPLAYGKRRFTPNRKRCTKRARFIGNLIVAIILILGIASVILGLLIITNN